MTDKTFEYGGYHFTPERQLTNIERSISNIIKHQKIDAKLGLCKKNYSYESKFEYSYESFYNATTEKDMDLFRCEENGKLYIPCTNDLQEYLEGRDKPKKPDMSEEIKNTIDFDIQKQVSKIITPRQDIDYSKLVLKSVEKEYADFYKEQLQKSKKDIFDNANKIFAYTALKNFFTLKNNPMDDIQYKCLYEDADSILSFLYDEYRHQDYANLESSGDIVEFIEDIYNRSYHRDILAEIELE